MAGKRANTIKQQFFKIILGSIGGILVGFYLLEEVSSWEHVIFGQVFYIVTGCVCIAVSGIMIFLAVKYRFFPKKKKRKSSPPVFLEDQHQKKSK